MVLREARRSLGRLGVVHEEQVGHVDEEVLDEFLRLSPRDQSPLQIRLVVGQHVPVEATDRVDRAGPLDV